MPLIITYKKNRRRWDSNPRYAYHIYTLSKRAPSAARTLLLIQGDNTLASIACFRGEGKEQRIILQS